MTQRKSTADGLRICLKHHLERTISVSYTHLHYAYHPSTGPASICVDVEENPLQVSISFADNGVPYDPLKKEDPDIGLSADEREIGGLGIFMVKKSMDDISYQYKDGSNILTIKKKF